VRRIVFSEQAKADIRAIPQQTALQILRAIHLLAETGAGRVKALQGEEGELRLRVGDFRVRLTHEVETAEDSRTQGEILRIHSVRDRKNAYR
jgi:mRNA-degrading endonuclease RelE of RelBE toxin-antitoxin system